jgi:hypothetical protein
MESLVTDFQIKIFGPETLPQFFFCTPAFSVIPPFKGGDEPPES